MFFLVKHSVFLFFHYNLFVKSIYLGLLGFCRVIAAFSECSVYKIGERHKIVGRGIQRLSVVENDLSRNAVGCDVLQPEGIVALAKTLVFVDLQKAVYQKLALIGKNKNIANGVGVRPSNGDLVALVHGGIHTCARYGDRHILACA